MDSGVIAYYDPGGRVIFIEVTYPADPVRQGIHLIGRPMSELVEDLSANGIKVTRDPNGGKIDGWKIGLYVPYDNVEAISFGET